MHFELSEDQTLIQDAARKFSDDRLKPHAAEWDENKHFPVDVLREAARRNLTQVTTGLLRLMKETGMPTDRIKSVLTRAQTLNTSTLAMG